MGNQTASIPLLVVIRLLSVAVTVRGHERFSPAGLQDSAPADYKTWPKLRLEGKKGRGTQGLTFYVDPGGVAIADDQTFPLGTVFIMEVGESANSGQRGGADVFVMVRTGETGRHCVASTGKGDWEGAFYKRRQRNRRGVMVQPGKVGFAGLPLDGGGGLHADLWRMTANDRE